MRVYWAKNRKTHNEELCFSIAVAKNGSDWIEVVAKDVYNLYVNGEFVCYGPARASEGYARVDKVRIAQYLTRDSNVIQIFVQGNNTKSMCFAEGEPYFGCNLLKEGEVVKTAEDFDCFFMQDKIVRVEKMSFQRAFSEIYDMKEDRFSGRSGYLPVEKIEVCKPKLLERNVKFALNEEISAELYGVGGADDGGEITWKNDFTVFQLDQGKNVFGYKRSECDVILSYELDKMRYFAENDKKYEYKAYQFSNVEVGKFKIKITVEKKSSVWLIYDDMLIDGKVKFNREQIIHGLKWTLEKGEYTLNSNEVYQAKYITLVYGKAVKIDGVSVIRIENPSVDLMKFKTDDEEINLIIEASARSFKHNAYDLPTDCASRERAGYLCDGYFTARAEKFFTGENPVERNFLENYLYFKNNWFESDGILPMCYPSSPKSKDDYIPNWVLWYIVQLGDCLKRTGDKSFIDRHREQVYKVLEFFKGYENEYGLLENLDGWVFVEWSKANEFISGVNFPSNMLYAGAIKIAGEVYADEGLICKFKKIKDVILKLSFNGEHFIDNAVRKNGKLVLTENVSETCQNYASFFEIVTSEENPEFYLKLENRFGALDETSKTKVWRSNMFIGYVLRMEVLYREKKYALLVKEAKETFLPMAKATGTIWEHFESHSSCNHGFGSVVGMLLYDSYKNLQKEKKGNER